MAPWAINEQAGKQQQADTCAARERQRGGIVDFEGIYIAEQIERPEERDACKSNKDGNADGIRHDERRLILPENALFSDRAAIQAKQQILQRAELTPPRADEFIRQQHGGQQHGAGNEARRENHAFERIERNGVFDCSHRIRIRAEHHAKQERGRAVKQQPVFVRDGGLARQPEHQQQKRAPCDEFQQDFTPVFGMLFLIEHEGRLHALNDLRVVTPEFAQPLFGVLRGSERECLRNHLFRQAVSGGKFGDGHVRLHDDCPRFFHFFRRAAPEPHRKRGKQRDSGNYAEKQGDKLHSVRFHNFIDKRLQKSSRLLKSRPHLHGV